MAADVYKVLKKRVRMKKRVNKCIDSKKMPYLCTVFEANNIVLLL